MIVGGHRPLYSIADDDASDQANLRAAVEELFVANGVDLYLCGHKHSYERQYPMCVLLQPQKGRPRSGGGTRARAAGPRDGAASGGGLTKLSLISLLCFLFLLLLAYGLVDGRTGTKACRRRAATRHTTRPSGRCTF